MLGGDIFILHPLGIAFGGGQHFTCLGRQADLQVGALDLGPFFELLAQFFLDGLSPAGHLGDDGPDDPIRLLHQRQQQVDGFDQLVLIILRQVLGGQQGLLGFLGILIEVHNLVAFPLT